MSVPKKIHYCWFGEKEKPVEVLDCIESWKKYAPEYEVYEWNEDNFPRDIMIPYAQEALDAKKFAFVTDYVRLYVLYKYGGIYLDTDIEMIKSFPNNILEHDFLGLESESTICTAVIGCKPKSKWVEKLLKYYSQRNFLINGYMDTMPNSEYIFNFIDEELKKLEIEDGDSKQISDELIVYGRDFFSPKDFVTGRINCTSQTITIHHYKGTWKSDRELVIGKCSTLLKRVVGKNMHQKIKSVLKK